MSKVTKGTARKQGQRERIEEHGRRLLAIFPNAKEQDPYKLCVKLRRLEAKAAALALRGCNGPEWDHEGEQEAAYDAVLADAKKLLGNDGKRYIPMFINRDPRGYQLKINDKWMAETGWPLERDWGGYGIIAPEIR